MIGFIGGTGPEGRGLALRYAITGEQILIGSRESAKAEQAAASLYPAAPANSVQGAINSDVAKIADTVFVTVPYSAQKDTLTPLKDALAGKIVIEVVAPLGFAKGRAYSIVVEEGSAALQAQRILSDSKVVAAFQNISAEELLIPNRSLECDVVVCADDQDAKRIVMAMAEMIKGVRALDGDGLQNARYIEDFTAMLLNINRIYKGHSMIKIVGV